MVTESKIEWTEQTWNPVTGCTKISPGCKHCYAETMSKRLHAMQVKGYENNFTVTVHPDRLNAPLVRTKPTVYFVNSMSDLFHEDVSDDFIDNVINIIKKTPHHTYQVLTKRAERLPQFFKNRTVPENMWIGVSVEDKKYGLPRIDSLREVNARVRFLSIEPLLEDIGEFSLTGINWVIVGGESGPAARPMCKEWVNSIKKICEKNSVAFFFKQWGTWGADGVRRNKKANGRLLDGRLWNNYP